MNSSAPPKRISLTRALLVWVGGTLSFGWFCATVLSSSQFATALISRGLWQSLMTFWNVELTQLSNETFEGDPGLLPYFYVACFSLVALLLGTAVASRHSLATGMQTLAEWAMQWKWWCGFLLWQLLWNIGLLTGAEPVMQISIGVLPFTIAIFLAAWLSGNILVGQTPTLERAPLLPRSPFSKAVVLGMITFVGIFTWMNWMLYWSLLTPHGDTAMYEEHLWNITHGKGFRSYLDQGLFLGEHMQVIHLLLLPAYLLWPSHLLLELCEALALGLCALPVYWIALRHTENRRAARWIALAALLYFPLHFLEISIDLKTFRPISFGVLLLLLTIDQFERQRWKTAWFVFIPLTLACKEDFAAILAPLGLWLAWDAWTRERNRDDVLKGLVVMVASVVYLILTIKVFIPAFREGDTVHYARYFGEFGSTPTDIIRSFLRRPEAVLQKLFSQRTFLYALALLVPLGGLPLRSFSRLLVAVPLFCVLSLMQLSEETGTIATDMLIPFHHFHAPLIPILFWAAAAGLGSAKSFNWSASRLASFACFAGLVSGIWFSLSPLGVAFWDPASSHYYKELYVPGERAAVIDKVLAQIPTSARVASTDYVHPRLTHYARSYDYSQYPRRVSGYEQRVPDDTDFIVIDTSHRYRWIQTPEEVPEFREHPDRWELLPDISDGLFLVLKRKPETTR